MPIPLAALTRATSSRISVIWLLGMRFSGFSTDLFLHDAMLSRAAVRMNICLGFIFFLFLAIEFQPLYIPVRGEFSVVKCQVTVYKSMCYCRLEGSSFKGRPPAFI